MEIHVINLSTDPEDLEIKEVLDKLRRATDGHTIDAILNALAGLADITIHASVQADGPACIGRAFRTADQLCEQIKRTLELNWNKAATAIAEPREEDSEPLAGTKPAGSC